MLLERISPHFAASVLMPALCIGVLETAEFHHLHEIAPYSANPCIARNPNISKFMCLEDPPEPIESPLPFVFTQPPETQVASGVTFNSSNLNF